jgi:hypothetical protein
VLPLEMKTVCRGLRPLPSLISFAMRTTSSLGIWRMTSPLARSTTLMITLSVSLSTSNFRPTSRSASASFTWRTACST